MRLTGRKKPCLNWLKFRSILYVRRGVATPSGKSTDLGVDLVLEIVILPF